MKAKQATTDKYQNVKVLRGRYQAVRNHAKANRQVITLVFDDVIAAGMKALGIADPLAQSAQVKEVA